MSEGNASVRPLTASGINLVGIEKAAFGLSALVCAVILVDAMLNWGQASLFRDEVRSVTRFASRGFWTAWTDYAAPNNHILLNIINSIWPRSLTFEPSAYRLTSFVSVTLAFTSIYYFSYKIGSFASGALIGLALVTNSATMDLVLQARGFALLFVSCVLQSIFLIQYVRTTSLKWLVALAVAGFVGSATIPLYPVFTGLVLIFLYVWTRKTEVIYASLVLLLFGLAFYAPTVGQIYEYSLKYREIWGTQYTGLPEVARTFYYLFTPNIMGLALALVTVSCFIFVFIYGSNEDKHTFSVIFTSIIVFIAICILIETTRIRTTQFIVGGIAVSFVAAGGTLYAFSNLVAKFIRASILFVCVPFFYVAVQIVAFQDFIPISSTATTALVVDGIRPNAESIFVNRYRPVLEYHLVSPIPAPKTFAVDAFRRGDQVHIDTSGGGIRIDELFSGRSYAPDAVDLYVPQRQGHYQVISFRPNRTGAIKGATMDEPGSTSATPVLDNLSSTQWSTETKAGIPISFEFALDRDVVCDRFFLFSGDRDGSFPESRIVTSTRNGKTKAVKERDINEFQGLLVVDIQRRKLDSLNITFRPNYDSELSVSQAWCEET